MEEILQLIERYGLTLILLLGSLYALYKFFIFSIYEVKGQFSKYHENNAKDMQYIKSKIDTILEFIKEKKWKQFVKLYTIWASKRFALANVKLAKSNV